MMEWYSQTTILNRLILISLIGVFSFVMYKSLGSLKHSRITWYNGFYTCPAFQVLMWIGATIFIIPLFFLLANRKTILKKAQLIGNVKSKVYHFPECEYQKKITSDVWRYPLKDKDEAENKGFILCNYCRSTLENTFKH